MSIAPNNENQSEPVTAVNARAAVHTSKNYQGIPFAEVELPVSQLTLSAEVPNFKRNADSKSGIVMEQRLYGSYERFGTAPIVVWERKCGTLEVITGRHRLDLAKRNQENTVPCHCIKESDGFTADLARILDAESNIRDGQGTIEDFVHYFKGSTINEEKARERALLSRNDGKTAWAIARHATQDTYDAWANKRINASQAAAIANGSGGNADIEREGIKYAIKGKCAEAITVWLKILAGQAPVGAQIDLFGADLAMSEAAMALAEKIHEKKRTIKQALAAIKGPARAPKLASQNGVSWRSCKRASKRIVELENDLKAVGKY